MKVSKLVADLTEFLERHGDLDVWVYANGCAGHYNCEPYMPLDGLDGVQTYQNKHGEQVARIETQW